MKLDDEYDIVDKYNNIYHRTIKVKPIDDGLYIKGDVFVKVFILQRCPSY